MPTASLRNKTANGTRKRGISSAQYSTARSLAGGRAVLFCTMHDAPCTMHHASCTQRARLRAFLATSPKTVREIARRGAFCALARPLPSFQGAESAHRAAAERAPQDPRASDTGNMPRDGIVLASPVLGREGHHPTRLASLRMGETACPYQLLRSFSCLKVKKL